MRTHEFVVDGERTIHCEGCEQRIASALGRMDGVREVRADHRTQEVRVTADDDVGPEAIRERLGRIGFPASSKEE